MSTSAKRFALFAILAAACGPEQHPPAYYNEPTCVDCDAGGSVVTPPPAAGQDAGPRLLDVDTWTGARVSFNVVPGRMVPPHFSAKGVDLIRLGKPATVHYAINKYDYTFTYDPTVSPAVTLFENIPAGSGLAMVTDIDGGNGILNSIIQCSSLYGVDWDLPVTTFQSLDDTYAPLDLVIDPSFAQAIISVSTGVNGDVPVPGATITVRGATAQAVIYDTGTGAYSATAGKTGPLGLAIIVNMNAVGFEYPGKYVTLYVTIGGSLHPFQPEFPIVKNTVSRVYYIQGGLEGG